MTVLLLKYLTNPFGGKIFIAILILTNLFMEIQTEYDIYSSEDVYKVPESKQREERQKQEMTCILEKLNRNYSSLDILTIDGKCPFSYDGIICWPEAEANTLVTRPCPNYVDSFRVNGTVRRQCMVDGMWFIKDNFTWTNYSDCKQSESMQYKQFQLIHILGQVGYGISLFSLVIAITILCTFRRLRCDRNYIHLNLFIAFLLRAVFYYPTLVGSSKIRYCRALRVINNYFLQTSYQSIFSEALYMHNMIFFHTFDASKANTPLYISLCWIVPAFVIGIWTILRYMFNNDDCWDSSTDELRRDFWFLNSYVIFLTLINCVLFINLICSLCSKVNSEVSREREKYKKLARSICLLVIVFGVYNIVFVPVEILYAIAGSEIAKKTEVIKLYFHHVINSCQGFLVSLLLCFVNGEVHREVKRFVVKGLSRFGFRNSSNHKALRSRRSQMYDYIPATSKSIVSS